jgi:hypothetical protein
MRRGDVEEHELVSPLSIISAGRLHGITGIAQVDELHALDDAPVLHVETGADALG